MSLEEKKQQIREDFSQFDEWLDKYEYLIELGKGLEPFPEEKKTEERLIKGCQSRVWLDCEVRDGCLWFTADSDAIITKGIISLLIDVHGNLRIVNLFDCSDYGSIHRLQLLHVFRCKHFFIRHIL